MNQGSAMRPAIVATVTLLIGLPPAAFAQEESRPFCADHPGLDTPTCTLLPGQFMFEAGLVDWTVDRQQDTRTEALTAGDFLLRIGLTDTLEAQVGLAAYERLRVRDAASGASDQVAGTGDLTLALRRNLRNPDGSGASIAVMAVASVPSGHAGIRALDWSAGILLPASVVLPRGLTLTVTPEIDAAVDAARKAHHTAFGSSAGVGWAMTDNVNFTAELAAFRDDDPAGHASICVAGLAAAWQTTPDSQVDFGINLGLNHASPDAEIYTGVALRF